MVVNFSEFLSAQPLCPLCGKTPTRYYIWAGDKGYDQVSKNMPDSAPWRSQASCGEHFVLMSAQKWALLPPGITLDDDKLETEYLIIRLSKYQIKIFFKIKKVILSLSSKDKLMANSIMKLELKDIKDWLNNEPFLTGKIEKLLILK